MTDYESIQHFLNTIDGVEVGRELRNRYRPEDRWQLGSMHGTMFSIPEAHPCTIVSIPTENLLHLGRDLRERYHPTDENYIFKMKKRRLYEMDPHFKHLCDQMNAYLHMFGDI